MQQLKVVSSPHSMQDHTVVDDSAMLVVALTEESIKEAVEFVSLFVAPINKNSKFSAV